MKSTENQPNIGQGILNHFYTQQIIDAKLMLVQELLMPLSPDASDQPLQIPKFEASPPM